jgi:heme exporter protein A
MLSVNQLTCAKGQRILFRHLEFTLQGGQWLHVAGDNGSGKTSLLRLLCGLSRPLEGDVLWQGQPLNEDLEAFHRELLYVGHSGGLKEELTPLENLHLSLEMEGFSPSPQTIVSALNQFGLKDREHLAVRHLSAGQKRRVLLARLLLRPASLWILDEPFNALDVRACAFLLEQIRNHLSTGRLAVLTSHQPIDLDNGQVVTL